MVRARTSCRRLFGGLTCAARPAAEVAELRVLYGPRKEWTELDAETVVIKRTANYGRGLLPLFIVKKKLKWPIQ